MQNAVRSWIPLCRRSVPGIRWQALQSWERRKVYSSLSRDNEVETWTVVCGSAGSINVDLYNTSALSNPTGPLILYLPPTGSHVRSSHPSIPSYLFHPAAAIARINYRWNIPLSTSTSISRPPTPTPTPTPELLSSHPSFTTHPFPTPLHDTLHAYTYILHSLLPYFSAAPSSTSTPLSPYSFPSQKSRVTQRPILIYGSQLGAALATSLVLTESFASKQLPTRIFGLIAKNGVYDWTGIATSLPPFSADESGPIEQDKSWQEQGETWDTTTLHAVKYRLFSTPASTFDPFASPALFFRTSGLSIPKTWPETSTSSGPLTPPPSRTPSNHEGEIFYPTPDHTLSTDSDSEEARSRGVYGGDLDIQSTRAANLKYPPKDSGLKIPRSLFLYSTPLPSPPAKTKSILRKKEAGEGGETNMKSQAQEIARLMRRSVVLHEFKERVLWDEDLDPHREAEERVRASSLSSSLEEEQTVREWINDTVDT